MFMSGVEADMADWIDKLSAPDRTGRADRN
jgi:hypothetical protein